MARRWDADDYARHSAAQFEWAGELIDKLDLGGGESLLDIGCGDGRATARLAAALPRGEVLGVDSSPEMIAAGRRRYPPAEHPNLRFEAMDAAALDLPPRFDVAFSNAVLHWVEDHRAVLRGVHACLRPGGRLLFQMGGRGNAAGALRIVDEVTRRPRWAAAFEGFAPPYHFYGPEEYERWLPECGFEMRRIELIAKDMRHEGLEALVGWLRTTWFPYTDRLRPAERDDFLVAVGEAYVAVHPADGDGIVHVDMVRLEVDARVAQGGRA